MSKLMMNKKDQLNARDTSPLGSLSLQEAKSEDEPANVEASSKVEDFKLVGRLGKCEKLSEVRLGDGAYS